MSNLLLLIKPGNLLEKRYEIVQELGQGGFGRTYLGKDHNRFQEFCVLKEFAPQVHNPQQLQLAQTLFQREAGMLYQLHHEQIPRFRELLKVTWQGEEKLFLVQDYIEGKSYWDILQTRHKFSEAEVKQLLLDILPILEYIHSRNLIHRDISPDNLIQRAMDHKPVLIDFGCVKQAVVTAVSQVSGQVLGTMVGKKGYAPDEQIRQGQAFPSSDLYALAVTALVLLTNKLPQELFNIDQNQWQWRHLIKIEPNFADILDQMLAYHPINRYQSATEVRQALTSGNNAPHPQIVSSTPTLVVAPGYQHQRQHLLSNITTSISQIRTQFLTHRQPSTQAVNQPNIRKFWGFWRLSLSTITAILLPGMITFSLIKGVHWQPKFPDFPQLPDFSQRKSESERQQAINQRLKDRKIDAGKFYLEVDRLFYNKYPQLKWVKLTNKPEHKKYREAWYSIAENLLDQQE